MTTAQRTIRPGEDHADLLDELYACHCRIFSGVSRAAFADYVLNAPAERTCLHLVRDDAGVLRGYTAYHEYRLDVAGQSRIIVRMETGMEPALQGQIRNGNFIMGQILQTCLRYPRTQKLFMATFVHPSAYIALRRCASQMWPSAAQPTPPEIQTLMDSLVGVFGLDAVGDGVYQVGWVTRESRSAQQHWRSRIDPDARFFLSRNPNYGDGEGLLSLIPVSVPLLLQGVVWFALRRMDRAWLSAPSIRTPRVRHLMGEGMARSSS